MVTMHGLLEFTKGHKKGYDDNKVFKEVIKGLKVWDLKRKTFFSPRPPGKISMPLWQLGNLTQTWNFLLNCEFERNSQKKPLKSRITNIFVSLFQELFVWIQLNVRHIGYEGIGEWRIGDICKQIFDGKLNLTIDIEFLYLNIFIHKLTWFVLQQEQNKFIPISREQK